MSDSRMLTAEELADSRRTARWVIGMTEPYDNTGPATVHHEDCRAITDMAHTHLRLIDTVKALTAEIAQVRSLVEADHGEDTSDAVRLALSAGWLEANREVEQLAAQILRLKRALTEALDGWEYEATRTREYVREEPSVAEDIARLRQEVAR